MSVSGSRSAGRSDLGRPLSRELELGWTHKGQVGESPRPQEKEEEGTSETGCWPGGPVV